MWGSRLRMLEDLATERARREELTRRVDAQQTTITFLCARLNHLELERALLFKQLTNIDLPVPRLDVTAAADHAQRHVDDPAATLEAISTLGIFDDNPAHAPAGWHADGTVNYGHLPVPATR